MVNEHTALSQHREQVNGPVPGGRQARLGHRDPGRLMEIGSVNGMECPKLAQTKGGRALVNVVRPELELGKQEVANRRRHVPVDLEPDRAAETAAAQLRLDSGEEVVGLALLEVEVGIARHPEGVVAPYLHVRE